VAIFHYGFMVRALVTAVFISIMTPMIGGVVVLRRMSNVGDALSHAGLAGVAVGLCLNVNPVLGALAAALAASFGMELVRRRFSRHAEMSTSVIMSAGIGLAAVLSGFVKNSAAFGSFLFGSAVAVGNAEMAGVIALCALVTAASVFLYRPLFYIAFDEEGAAAARLPVRLINAVFTAMTAVVVSVSSRAVGALMISSLLVIPVACAMRVSWSYRSNMALSVAFALFFSVTGMFLSFYAGWKPGGAIVLVGIGTLAVLMAAVKKR